MSSDDVQNDSLAISNRVRDLMERRGVAKRAQASELARLLDLSFSAASRKMKGQLPWDLRQLQIVATHFGESPSTLIVEPAATQTIVPPDAHDALLMVAPRTLHCAAWLGNTVNGDTVNLVAIQDAGAWRIYPAETAPAGERFHVERIEIRPNERRVPRPSIAVLDDALDMDTADSICQYLNEHGMSATPFHDLETFGATLRTHRFDAFVLDWIIGDETAETAIVDIRHGEHRFAPIFVLTGQLKNGLANADDIARVIRQFDCDWAEKPLHMSILFSEITSKLKDNRVQANGSDT